MHLIRIIAACLLLVGHCAARYFAAQEYGTSVGLRTWAVHEQDDATHWATSNRALNYYDSLELRKKEENAKEFPVASEFYRKRCFELELWYSLPLLVGFLAACWLRRPLFALGMGNRGTALVSAFACLVLYAFARVFAYLEHHAAVTANVDSLYLLMRGDTAGLVEDARYSQHRLIWWALEIASTLLLVFVLVHAFWPRRAKTEPQTAAEEVYEPPQNTVTSDLATKE